MTTQQRPLRINYARPSFAEGMARVLDIGGTLNQYDAEDWMEIYREMRAQRLARPAGPEAEAEAIREVWLAVGQHIRDAMGQFEAADSGNARSAEMIK